MGLPMSLDGKSESLKLKKPIVCRNCRNPIETVKLHLQTKVRYCPICGAEIPPKSQDKDKIS